MEPSARCRFRTLLRCLAQRYFCRDGSKLGFQVLPHGHASDGRRWWQTQADHRAVEQPDTSRPGWRPGGVDLVAAFKDFDRSVLEQAQIEADCLGMGDAPNLVFDVQRDLHALGEEQEAEFAFLLHDEMLPPTLGLGGVAPLGDLTRSDAGHEARQGRVVGDRVPHGLGVCRQVQYGLRVETAAAALYLDFDFVGHGWSFSVAGLLRAARFGPRRGTGDRCRDGELTALWAIVSGKLVARPRQDVRMRSALRDLLRRGPPRWQDFPGAGVDRSPPGKRCEMLKTESESILATDRQCAGLLPRACWAVMLVLALAACGAEVAVGAATAGSLQAEQAQQAQAQQAKAVERLKAAQEAAAARSASAADAAGQ